MDKTETYIKLMVKAPEIWNSWEYCIGDYVVFRDVGRLDQPFRVRLISYVDNAGTIFLLGDHEFQSYSPNKFYPVPRQDQWQEMVKQPFIHILLQQFLLFINCIDTKHDLMPTKIATFAYYWEENGEPKEFSSMDQLWMAFVMWEKHNKTWDGEKWTLIESEVSNVR